MNTPTGPVKLLVLVCEEALEPLIGPAIIDAGAKGYTVCDARGRGARGVRDARWSLSSNIRIEVLCTAPTAQRILELVDRQFCDNYGLVIYMHDVEASRAGKF